MDKKKYYKLINKNDRGGNVMNAVKVINIERFNDSKTENNEHSEWDIISNLFSNAAKRKKLSKSQIEKIADEVKTEVNK